MFSGLSKSRTSSISSLAEIDVGDRVIVAGQRKGTIKFVGDTKFAPGKAIFFFSKAFNSGPAGLGYALPLQTV